MSEILTKIYEWLQEGCCYDVYVKIKDDDRFFILYNATESVVGGKTVIPADGFMKIQDATGGGQEMFVQASVVVGAIFYNEECENEVGEIMPGEIYDRIGEHFELVVPRNCPPNYP